MDGTLLPPELQPLQEGDPASVDRFRIVGRLGSGGMGIVYGGLDELGRCVAVKTLREHYAAQPRFRKVFTREVKLLVRVDGVCVPRVRAADIEAEAPWMAADFVPGRTLRGHTTQVGVLRGAMLRAFAAGTAEALAAIHSVGVVHRDIKPGNVILSPDGPRVVDFGIAVAVEHAQEPDATSGYGTPGWVAPERYRGEPATAAADMFAWGGLLVMAATGQGPFGSGTAAELKERVLHEDPDLADLPDEMREVAAGALAKDPEERPDAETLLRDLLGPPEGQPAPDRRPVELDGRLRGLLADTWRGIDAAGHHPASWAALAAAGGAAAGAAAGVAAAGSAGGAAASSGTAAGGGGVIAGTLGGVTAKTAAIGAGSVVTAGALVAGGYVATEALLGPSPQEQAATAARVLQDGEGFTAVMQVEYTREHAERQAADNQAVEDVLEESREVHHLRFSGGEPSVFSGESVFVDHEGQEFPRTVVNRGGDLYIYEHLQYQMISRGVYEPAEAAPRSYSPIAVAGPLRSLAEAEELAQESREDGTTVLSGPLTGHVFTTTVEQPDPGLNFSRIAVAGQVDEEPGSGTLTVGEDGRPLRLEYQTGTWEVAVAFGAVNEPVAIEEPDTADPDAGMDPVEDFGAPFGPVLVYAPECGILDGPDGGSWQVEALSWDLDCEDADRIAQRFLAAEGEDYWEAVGLDGVDTPSRIIEDEWLCTAARREGFTPEHCYPGGYTEGEPAYAYDRDSPAIGFEMPGSPFDQ